MVPNEILTAAAELARLVPLVTQVRAASPANRPLIIASANRAPAPSADIGTGICELSALGAYGSGFSPEAAASSWLSAAQARLSGLLPETAVVMVRAPMPQFGAEDLMRAAIVVLGTSDDKQARHAAHLIYDTYCDRLFPEQAA